jgi:hypothetical protein
MSAYRREAGTDSVDGLQRREGIGIMPRELNIIQTPTSNGDACTYMWACAICDENESCQKDKEGHSRWLVAKRMERIEYKVLIMSNKGGVGKSTCTTNLAVSLALKGWHVGICDMDIHGPNIPKMVGAEGQKLKISTSGGIIPFQAYNLRSPRCRFYCRTATIPSSGATHTSINSSISCSGEWNGRT